MSFLKYNQIMKHSFLGIIHWLLKTFSLKRKFLKMIFRSFHGLAFAASKISCLEPSLSLQTPCSSHAELFAVLYFLPHLLASPSTACQLCFIQVSCESPVPGSFCLPSYSGRLPLSFYILYLFSSSSLLSPPSLSV